MNTQALSVIIPIYNEEESIEKNILLLYEFLHETFQTYEIVCVNDGSTDNTLEILNRLKETISPLCIVHYETNKGLGHALRMGFAASHHDIIFYTDSDMPVHYEDIMSIVEIQKKHNADMVHGIRVRPTDDAIARLIYSKVYNCIFQIVFGVHIPDVNSPCKLFKRDALLKLNLQANGSFIDAEIVAKASYRGLKIQTAPFMYYKRTTGVSKMNNIHNIATILFEMFMYYRAIRRMRKQTLGR